MVFPFFGNNIVHSFRILKPLDRDFRQSRSMSAGRHRQMTATKICFSLRETAEILICCALKKRKYHVLKLYQTRFFIFYIFFDKIGENRFRAIELLKRDFGCRPAVGRPTSKIPFQKFDGAKSILSNFIKYVTN